MSGFLQESGLVKITTTDTYEGPLATELTAGTNITLTVTGSGADEKLRIDATGAAGIAGGDLSGTYPDPTVIKLRGRSISSSVPPDGYYLRWSQGVSEWYAAEISVINIAGGDLSGTYPDPTVIRLQSRDVSASIPTDGYALTWSASGSKWLSDKPIPGGIAGGDLSGTYPNPDVIRLQSRLVSLAAPTDGYGLTWNDSAAMWITSKPIPGGTAGGDLSGFYPKPIVAKLQSRDVDSGAPTDGYALTWDAGNSMWVSEKPIPGGTAGGDLSGTYPNPIVAGLQGRSVSNTAPTDGYAIIWNDGASEWQPGQSGINLTPINAGDNLVYAASIWQLISMRGPIVTP